jgi:hypothetical protein
MKKLKKKRQSGYDALSRVSGLSKDTIKGIARQVMKNNEILDSCSFHIFEPCDSPSMSRVYKCKNCGGTVRDTQKIWYEKGIEHSQKRTGAKGELS